MLTAEISVLDYCLSWLVAFLAQLNPLEAPVMDTFVAGHIRRVWASSKSKCRMHDAPITMDVVYMTLQYRILIKLWQTISPLAFLFLHTCVRTVSMCSVSAVSKLFSYGSRIHIYF